MEVNTVTTPTNLNGTATETVDATDSTNEEGREMFLSMLIAQLKNQDPLNPMDGTDFTAQLAQFSSLEEMFKINNNLSTLQTIQGSQNNNLMTGMIGKEITAKGNSTYINGDKVSDISFELNSNAKTLDLSIYDSVGSLVRTIKLSNIASGEQSLSWDGTDRNGVKLADGVYSYRISAEDASGEPIGATTYTKGEATSVSFNEDGSTSVWVGKIAVATKDILKVSSL